jgi:RsiW-degrading membrane proteinase PrsW (M82 family)
MVLGFDLIGFFALFLPPLLYAWIIYVSSPYKSLSLRSSSKFITGGVFSIIILNFIMVLFPLWDPHYIQDPFWGNFWAVAPREEISKFLMFFILYKGLDNKNNKHPITYMFYFGMIGLGFALIENISYVSQYGFWVLKLRTFGAVFVHMICGLLFGYWIGIGTIQQSKFTQRTIASIFLSSRPKLKSFLYITTGLITASTFHGLWNYHIQTFQNLSTPISILMLMVGFLACKLLSRDLINQSQKSTTHESLESRIDKDLDKI